MAFYTVCDLGTSSKKYWILLMQMGKPSLLIMGNRSPLSVVFLTEDSRKR